MTAGLESYLPNAYWRTYDGVNGTANKTNGTSENPPAKRRTWSPPSPNGDYGDTRPCAAHRE